MEREHETDTQRVRVARSAARSYHWAATQPSWVVRIALLTFLLVVALPILLLLAVAAILATAVFAVLSLAERGVRRLRGTRRDGRANVRVIRRQ